MLQPIERLRRLDSVVRYTTARLIMADALDRLPKDRGWGFLLESDKGKDAQQSWSLEQLLAYEVMEDLQTRRPLEPRPPQPKAQALNTAKAPTGPPSGIARFTIGAKRRVEPLHEIVTELGKLGDGQMLTHARRYSARYDGAIYRWATLREDLGRAASNTPDIFLAIPTSVPQFVPDFPQERMRKFTLPQLERLIRAEMPSREDTDALGRETIATVNLPAIGFPTNLPTAVVLVEFGLLISTAYFWLFYREARRSAAFPAAGTLFGALARSRTSRGLFVVGQAVPVMAALLLAQRTWWLDEYRWIALVAVLVLVAMVLVRRLGALQTSAVD